MCDLEVIDVPSIFRFIPSASTSGYPQAVRVRRPKKFFSVVYYESIKRELNKRLIFECRCDARLNAKAEGSCYVSLFSAE